MTGLVRRLLAAAALGGVLVALLAGCAKPEGVDGDIADDWRPIAEAKPFVPQAGACLQTRYAAVGYLSSYTPVDCAQDHFTETVYVGAFTGAAAEANVPPAAGSPAIREAYAECDKQAKAYLGDDWRVARLWLGLTLPNPNAWTGGARWYRCEVVEVAFPEEAADVRQRRGSLKGALTATSQLRLGCYTVKTQRGEIDQMRPAGCGTAHRAEFVGVYTAPPEVPYPKGDERRDIFLAGCRVPLARFADVPNDADLRFRSGLIWIPPREEEWTSGDRGIRCYLWVSDRDLTKSMRDAGPSGLPVR